MLVENHIVLVIGILSITTLIFGGIQVMSDIVEHQE